MGTQNLLLTSFRLALATNLIMIFKITIFSFLTVFTNGSIVSLQQNIQNYLNSKNTTTPLRAFAGFIQSSFEPISEYGCWCYLDTNRPTASAHGPVVDSIDESCRDLINAYKCIEIDEIDCDAQQVSYIPYNFFSSETDLETECQTQNSGNNCAIKACIAEGAFTLRFISFMSMGASTIQNSPEYSSDFVHVSKGGSFDPEINCPSGAKASAPSEIECCGEYAILTKKPFRTDYWQCCNGGLIDVLDVCV